MRLDSETKTEEVSALLVRLCAFCFPGGEGAARRVRGVRTTEKGEMRMSPEARWVPFTAEQFIDATRSNFCWEARLDPGKIASPTITDAYEKGRGRLVVKVGGVLPVQKITGPDADRGELQRYLGSIALCPAILLNHATLEWNCAGPLALRVCDREDKSGISVDISIGEDGRPMASRADRPRVVGKKAVLTPWMGSCAEFREWEGLRVADKLEVTWHLAEGSFVYYRSEITSLEAVR